MHKYKKEKMYLDFLGFIVLSSCMMFVIVSFSWHIISSNKTSDVGIYLKNSPKGGISVSASNHQGIEDIENDKSGKYYPSEVKDKLNHTTSLNYRFSRTEYQSVRDYTEAVNDYVKNTNRNRHQETDLPNEVLNNNVELSVLINKAKEIDKKIDKTENHKRLVEYYLELIEIYQKAYEIAPTGSISLQLIRPYEEIVSIYGRSTEEEKNEIFIFGEKGLDEFIETLNYNVQNIASDGDLYYRAAQLYYTLGDLPELQMNLRNDLYHLSVAYFTLAHSKNLQTYETFCDYYRGMVFHKLGVISKEDNYQYLLYAIDSYEMSLKVDGMSYKMRRDLYTYISDCYKRLESYIRDYGKRDELKDMDYYAKEAQLYLDMRDKS